MPARPQIIPPVGKSGAGTRQITFHRATASSASKANTCIDNFAKLWGGTEVAIPTAIPAVPLIRKLGNLLGRITGSTVDSSKFGTKVNGLFIKISKNLLRYLLHTNFGISHSCCIITIYRTPVTLTIKSGYRFEKS